MNDSSNIVSDIMNTSTFPLAMAIKWSNYLQMKVILMCPMSTVCLFLRKLKCPELNSPFSEVLVTLLEEKVLISDLPKFGNSSISMKKVIVTKIWPGKPLFLRDGLGSSSIIWDWHQARTWNLRPVWQKSEN